MSWTVSRLASMRGTPTRSMKVGPVSLAVRRQGVVVTRDWPVLVVVSLVFKLCVSVSVYALKWQIQIQ